MPVPKSQYKNVSFYSGFSYLHPILTGSATAVPFTDILGTVYTIDVTIPIPAEVVTRPPYVRFFVNTQGLISEVEANSNLYVGSDSSNIRIFSDGNNRPFPYTVYYHIYDRTVS